MKSFICSRCGIDIYAEVMVNNYVNRAGVLYCNVGCANNRFIPISPRRVTPKDLKKYKSRKATRSND